MKGQPTEQDYLATLQRALEKVRERKTAKSGVVIVKRDDK